MGRDKGRARRQEVAEEKAAVAMENTRAIRAALRRRDELAAAQRRREQDALTDATEEADRARHEKAAARPAKAYFAQGKARQGRREKRRTSASRVHSATQNACGEGWYGSWFLSKQAAVTCSNHGLDAEDIVMALGASGEPRGKRTLELGLRNHTHRPGARKVSCYRATQPTQARQARRGACRSAKRLDSRNRDGARQPSYQRETHCQWGDRLRWERDGGHCLPKAITTVAEAPMRRSDR
jgi:hypothetical protein